MQLHSMYEGAEFRFMTFWEFVNTSQITLFLYFPFSIRFIHY